MVIDHTAGLQMGVDGDRTQIFESAFFQFLTDLVGQLVSGHMALLVAFVDQSFSAAVVPDKTVEGAVVLDDFQKSGGVGDDSLDFPDRFYHAGGVHDLLDFLIVIGNDFVVIKIVKALPEYFTFFQHHGPV